MTKPKRKPRGVVERFLAGESLDEISWDLWHERRDDGFEVAIERAEAILRRALKKKTGKR